MNKANLIATLCLSAFLSLAPTFAGAQDAMTRTEIKRSDLAGTENTQVIMATLEARPGAKLPRHIHHGDEFLYVIEGGTVEVPGKDPIAFKAGQAIHFPRGMPHGGFTVIGDKPLKALTVHVVDKDKPLVELVD